MLLTLLSTVILTARVETLSLRALGEEAAAQERSTFAIESGVADEVVLRRSVELRAIEQLRVLCSSANYTLREGGGKVHLGRGPGYRSSPSLVLSGPDSLVSVVAAQTLDFAALQPGERMVLSNRPTQTQFPLRAGPNPVSWLTAERTIYGLRFSFHRATPKWESDTESGAAMDPTNLWRPAGGAKRVALRGTLQKWISRRLQRFAGSERAGPQEALLTEDPVALMYRALLEASVPDKPILFLVKDATVASLFAMMNRGEILPERAWQWLDQMHGLRLVERQGVFVGEYTHSGVSQSGCSPWIHDPAGWTPEALSSMSLDRAAEIWVEDHVGSYGLRSMITDSNDVLGVSVLRQATDLPLIAWHALSAAERADVRAKGRRTFRLGTGTLRQRLERWVLSRTVMNGMSTVPEDWPLGDAWDEPTFRLPRGLPEDAELEVTLSRVPVLLTPPRDGRRSALQVEDLATELLHQMRKNPGGEDVVPVDKEFGPTTAERLDVTVRVPGVMVSAGSCLGSVAPGGVRFVPYGQVDKGFRDKATARAKRMMGSSFLDE